MQQEFAVEESRRNQVPGERFCPMDDELLLFYLKPMLSGQMVPGRNIVVFDCDLYGHQEPWEIWEIYKTSRSNDLRLKKDLYFFTQHKKMSSTDKRVRRTVGSGTWKGDDSGKSVKSFETGRVVGLKKRFSYKNEESVHNGCWILYEFSLDRSLRDKNQKLKDYVLCLLRKSGEPKTKIEKKRKERDEEEVLENSYACGDGENTNKKQEELLEPQEKRQRIVPSVDNVSMPSEFDAFADELEDMLPYFEGDHDPSETGAIGFEGEKNGGLQEFASEVQAGPTFGDDHGMSNPLPDDYFLLGDMLKAMDNVADDLDVTGATSNIDVAEENSTLLHTPTSAMSAAYDGIDMLYSENGFTDPAGRNSLCGGSVGFQDGAYWPQSLVEVTADEQQRTADGDNSERSDFVTFTPEDSSAPDTGNSDSD